MNRQIPPQREGRIGTMAIAVNPVTNKIYVGNQGCTVSAIDGATDAVTATLKVGALPYVVCGNPTTNKILLSRKPSATS